MQKRTLAALAVLILAVSSGRADDWPQWLGPKRDGVWRETGIIKTIPREGLKARWRTPVGGGYAGPAVAGGKVYITDRQLAQGASNPANPFNRRKVEGTERVLCLDEATGKVLWKHEYPCTYEISYPYGPRCTPVIANGKVWTLGAMGDLFCLDANSGKVIWSKNFPKDYGAPVPLWGFAAHPLLDGERLICLVGGQGSVVVAFNKDTGKEIWKSLSLNSAELGYCPPMIYEAAGKRQLIIWHPEAVVSLDPETGKPYWSHRWAIRANLSIPTPRKQGDYLFFTSFYNGSLMLKLDQSKPAATQVWRGPGRGEQPRLTADLHSIMCTPVFKDGHIYGVCSYGEFRCLKAETGERLWEDLTATGSKKQQSDRWNNVFIVENDGRYFLFHESGTLILAELSPKGYKELGRAKVLERTTSASSRDVVWSHPAFANKCMFARNDKEIVCVPLGEK